MNYLTPDSIRDCVELTSTATRGAMAIMCLAVAECKSASSSNTRTSAQCMLHRAMCHLIGTVPTDSQGLSDSPVASGRERLAGEH